jgi:hypothetical protein
VIRSLRLSDSSPKIDAGYPVAFFSRRSLAKYRDSLLMRPGSDLPHSSGWLVRLCLMPARSESNCVLSTIVRLTAIWHCCVNGSIRLPLDSLMDACSLLPSVLYVAFFLRKNIRSGSDATLHLAQEKCNSASVSAFLEAVRDSTSREGESAV